MVSLLVTELVLFVVLLSSALACLWLCLIKDSPWLSLLHWLNWRQSPPPNAVQDVVQSGGTSRNNLADSSSLVQNDSRNCDNSELNEVDLKGLISYLEETDGGPPWQFMVEMSTPTLLYQSWYRDPPIGPTQLRTRTVFQNVTPELARDFFWDDEFRPNWDNMLVYHKTLEIHPQTGSMVVQWIRKLPLFCGNREYIIIRRIWNSESTYYCVTKGTSHPSIPRHARSNRVEFYYSSWCIRAVLSNGGQGRGTEVLLFHHEDMNLPKRLVKMAVRAGTWGLVKRLDANMQAYSKAQADGAIPSTSALMARMGTSLSASAVALPQLATDKKQKPRKGCICRWLIMGGILLTCVIMGVKITSRRKKKSGTISNQ